MKREEDIFSSGSKTYFWSSKFFPKGVRDDVYKLYSFVRVVDDYIDATPQQTENFAHICSRWSTIKSQLKTGDVPSPLDDSVDELVLYNIAYITHRYKCDPTWVDAFLASMQMDVDGRIYESINDSIEYMYGSAEVIGLFMVQLMKLPGRGQGKGKPEPDVYRYARYQGRAMQWINFIRDIAEDIELKRCYFPARTLKSHGLRSLDKDYVQSHQESFEQFVREQIELYNEWQAEATKGFSYIPKRQLIAVKTAVDMYNWTAEQISKNPMIVYEKKVKPTKSQILKTAAKNSI